jgi:hypothetical protein
MIQSLIWSAHVQTGFRYAGKGEGAVFGLPHTQPAGLG